MRELTNAIIRKVSLVKRPANKRPFHMLKSADKDLPMPSADAASEDLKALPDEVQQRIAGLELAKSADTPEARAALEAIGVLAHNHPGLSIDALLAVGEAAGLAKAAKADDEDDADEEDEEDDEPDEDENEQDAGAGKKMPEFVRNKIKGKKPMKKAAEPLDVEKSEREAINKALDEARAELKDLRQSFAKSQKELAAEREIRLTKAVKDELAGEFRQLSVNIETLAPVIKSMRDEGKKEQADELLSVLRSADEQLAVAGRNGNVFAVVGKSARGMPGNATPWDRINAKVDELAKSDKRDRSLIMRDYTNTNEGKALVAEHDQLGVR